MKAVILAGGLGTRLSEETTIRPKPMVEIGGKPVLWHIMKIYSAHGINDFIVCLGYKGYLIKEYFANYFLHQSDVTFDLAKNRMQSNQNTADPCRATPVDTGAQTVNGGFFVLSPKVSDYIEGDATTWEREPLENLARDGQMSAFQHHGFWQPMDTLRDKVLLENLWASGKAPWKTW